MPENVAPAPAPSSAPTVNIAPPPPSSGFKQPEGAHSAHDIFKEFENSLGWKDEQAPDFKDARSWKDGTIDDLIGDNSNNEDPTVGPDPEKEKTPQEDEFGNVIEPEDKEKTDQDDEFSYDFEDEIGGKEHKIQFKSREQLNTAIKKAVVADRLYKENKDLKANIQSYDEDRSFARNMDDYLENRPFELMDMVIEDLPEEEIKNWLIQKAEWYGQDQEVRRQARVAKENEMLRKKIEAIEQAETRAKEQRSQLALEADRHVVKSWGAGILTKMKSRIPDTYHGIVEKELRNTLIEARHLQNQNVNVDVKTLDKIFQRNMRPMLDLISEKTNTKVVDREVGRVLNEKKQQNLTRVQAVASQAMSSRNQMNSRQKELEDNPIKAFDYLIEGIDQGKFRMKA